MGVVNESRTDSYVYPSRASPETTAIIFIPHPNPFRDSLQLRHVPVHIDTQIERFAFLKCPFLDVFAVVAGFDTSSRYRYEPKWGER